MQKEEEKYFSTANFFLYNRCVCIFLAKLVVVLLLLIVNIINIWKDEFKLSFILISTLFLFS